jgi:hypothetical protein
MLLFLAGAYASTTADPQPEALQSSMLRDGLPATDKKGKISE